MTETPVAAAQPSGPRPPRRRASTALRVVLIIVLVLLLGVLLLVLNRRDAARDVLVGWLDRRGIQADVEVERIDLDGFVARVSIGDPTNPDVTVDRVEVDYAVNLPWSSSGLGVTPSRIRLVRPVLRARWIDGRFSMGSLDPLIEEFTGRPPQPDARGPLVLIEDGRLALTTEYGPVQVFGDARVEDGKLMRLQARLPTAALRSGDLSAQVEAAAIEVTTTNDRTVVGFNARLDSLRSGDLTLDDAAVTLGGALPYPDFQNQRGDGQVWLNPRVRIGRLAAGQTAASDLVADLVFRGRGAGWIDLFRLSGRGDVLVSAGALDTPGVTGSNARYSGRDVDLTLSRSPRGVDWRADGPAALTASGLTLAGMAMTGVTGDSARMVAGGRDAAFEISGPLDLSAARFIFDTLTLRAVRGRLDMDVVSDSGLLIRANGPLSASNGAWPLFGPVAADDVIELAEIKRALGDFALQAPAVRITTGSPGTEIVLAQPARLTPTNGGVLTIAPVARPIFAALPDQNGGGAFTMTATRGRGLPQMQVAVTDWGLTGDGFRADVDARAALDFAFARGATIDTTGTLASGGGRLTYEAQGCAAVTSDQFDLGENDVFDVSGDLCPVSGTPLLVVRDGAWRVLGRLRGVAATVPFLAVQASEGAGTLTVDGAAAGIGLQVEADRVTLTDTTDPRRFNPLFATGVAALANEDWTGQFDIGVGQSRLGSVSIAHDGPSGAGGVAFDVSDLTFAPGALQPTLITPLLDGLMKSPVTGAVDFTGRFDWTEDAEPTSSGLLTTRGLDFTSPAGPVTGLKGSVAFTSLTPLVTAPDQRLTIDRIDAFAPLTDLEIDFGLDANTVTISGADVAVGGGFIRIEPFALPLTPDAPWSGVLVLDRVQLGDLVAGTGFKDKVMLDAVVSGRLPFAVDAEGTVTLSGGALAAVEPGRLSIQREALTGLEAGGGGEDVPPNVVQDLAYQAMENLDFTTLTADVNSAPNGRLAIVFHIVGEHRPPVPQELRLTLQELITRDFLNRESLPLPSGTAIDLTLDTTINLDRLLADWAEIQRARNGEPVAEPTNP